MTRYHVTATQKFTDEGKIGVWRFLGSPILQGICFAWYINELFSYSPDKGPRSTANCAGQLERESRRSGYFSTSRGVHP